MAAPRTPLYHASMNPHPRRVCLLVTGPVGSDPRVSKQCRALSETGRYEVHAIGVRRPSRAPWLEPAWPRVKVEHVEADPSSSWVARRADTVRRALVNVVPSTEFARRTYYAWPSHHAALRDRAFASRAELYHANDWDTLPIAIDAAAACGAQVIYDSHELATEEESTLRFRLLRAKLRDRIERGSLPRVGKVVVVSEGLGERLVERYRLDPSRVVVVRSAAEPCDVARAPLDPARIKVLYHGVAREGRGLETLVDSVPWWPERYTLSIRATGEPAYLDALRERARARGVERRVALLRPVPMDQLVPSAAAFDVGIHPLSSRDANNRIALPNKFFEYAMVGLAVLTTDLPELRRLIERHALGAVFAPDDAAAIARVLVEASPENIAHWQESARRFSREVNASTEFAKLVALYDELLHVPEIVQ